MNRVLVTGGATGIGKAIAKAFSDSGSKVVIAGRRIDLLRQTSQELGIDFIQFDVCKDDPKKIFECHPDIDGLINNAGTYESASVGSLTREQFYRQLDVHVIGPALLSQEFVRQKKQNGFIVNISSTLAEKQVVGSTAYSLAKAAQISLTKSLAVELAAKNIRVNAVLPAVVETDMTVSPRSHLTTEEQIESFTKLHPLGRIGKPDDIAQAVVWLANAKWVTGTTVVVDGGLLVGNSSL